MPGEIRAPRRRTTPRCALVLAVAALLAACAVPRPAAQASAEPAAAPQAPSDARALAADRAYPGARTYSGVYSCAGCDARRLTVTIFADGTYRLREEAVGAVSPDARGVPSGPPTGTAGSVNEQGSWQVPAEAPERIVLESAAGLRAFRRSAPDALTIVDHEGRELHGLDGATLSRSPHVDPLAVAERLVGFYGYQAGQRVFIDCASGRRFPMQAEAGNAAQRALDSAVAALAPQADETVLTVVHAHRVPAAAAGGAGVAATAGGTRAGTAATEALVVDAFERATRNGSCEDARPATR